jgi:hypothetical protein
MKRYAIRTLGDTGPQFTLAPERHRPAVASRGVPLYDLAEEVSGRVTLDAGQEAIVIDTTHVREGTIHLPPARNGVSPKTTVPVGSVLVSRIRPYLRQIGLVSDGLFMEADSQARTDGGRSRLPLLCSTEFSVLVPKAPGGDPPATMASARRPHRSSLAFLLPFLLSAEVQTRLMAGQEGGHRPRVPRETLMSLRVPEGLVRARLKTSASVERALAEYYAAELRCRKALGL